MQLLARRMTPHGITRLEELGGTHPRTAGARAETIRLGQENDIPMMQLMSILSYNAAKHLGDTGLTFMQERGRIQKGMVADIVVFDPETFTDNSTYETWLCPFDGHGSRDRQRSDRCA